MSSWDEEPKPDERRANAPDTPKHGRKKNTRRWCKGKVGVEHQLEVKLDERQRGWRTRVNRPMCYRPDWYSKWWSCSHMRVCTVCGKILKHNLGRDCPNWTRKITVFRDVELAKIREVTKNSE